MKKIFVMMLMLCIVMLTACGNNRNDDEVTGKNTTTYACPQDDDNTSEDDELVDKKPVIYLYPEQQENVSVKLKYNGKLTCTYPEYKGEWNVTAFPSGKLIDKDGKFYNYLYWEGKNSVEYDFSEGFCIAGKDTVAFLEKSLEQLGLTRKEANEFIVYWLPEMQDNAYNLISFQNEVYTDNAQLEISPKPDTLIRVFMAWKPLKEAEEITEQDLSTPMRNGFTVVEWGGSKVAE